MENWANRKTLILSRTDMIGLLAPAEYNSCVEQAYRMHGEGRFFMEPKGHIVLDKYPGEWEAMPSYIEEPEAAACKWVSIREQNREKFGLPTVFSILIYTHPETGFPLAIVDGSYHTLMRTGSSAAVSAKWLARKTQKVWRSWARVTWPRAPWRPATKYSTGKMFAFGAAVRHFGSLRCRTAAQIRKFHHSDVDQSRRRGAGRGRGGDANACKRADCQGRMDRAGHAYCRRRRRQGRRSGTGIGNSPTRPDICR